MYVFDFLNAIDVCDRRVFLSETAFFQSEKYSGVKTEAKAAAAELRAGKLYKARFRLYRSQILQENMRLKALAGIYTMQSFAQL